jgi:hypothetical protein
MEIQMIHILKEKIGSAANIAAGLLLFTACASTPQPPTAAIEAAELAIAYAEQMRVEDHASPELSEARDKLAEARSAVQQEQMVRALRLAEQSRVDAELAAARAEEFEARTVNEEMLKGMDTLKEEMQRNTGDLHEHSDSQL